METNTHNIRTFGHRGLLLAGLILLTLGCAKDPAITTNLDTTASNSIIGEWEWIKTVDAWTQQEKTPGTEGYTATMKFKTNDTVDYFKNGSLSNTYPYEFRYRINDQLNPNSNSTLVLVINNEGESFFSIDNDTLIISQAYIDGPTDYYERKK